jgi:hypothetical protein
MTNLQKLYQIQSLINNSQFLEQDISQLPTSTWIELEEYIEVLITIEKEYID